jgi:hypothetical protein
MAPVHTIKFYTCISTCDIWRHQEKKLEKLFRSIFIHSDKHDDQTLSIRSGVSGDPSDHQR